MEDWRGEIQERSRELRVRRLRAIEAPARGRYSANIGQVLEQLVPVLETSTDPRDWRSLSDPVDYLVFQGLSRHEQIQSLAFVEVKTGAGRLNDNQRLVQRAVEARRVRFQRVERRQGK